MTGARWVQGRIEKSLRGALAVAALAACQAGLAQVESAQLEVAASSLPRLDRAEGFATTPRVDVTLLPPRDGTVGLALGMQGYNTPATPAGAGLAPTVQPAVDVGLHWRHRTEGSYQIGVTAYRRVPQAALESSALGADREPTYGARVEVNLNGARKEKAWADKGLLGVQLDNGGRVSLRRKYGGPMIYYRNSF